MKSLIRFLNLLAPGAFLFFLGTVFVGYATLHPFANPLVSVAGVAAYFCLAAYIGGVVARTCARMSIAVHWQPTDEVTALKEDLAALRVVLDDTHDLLQERQQPAFYVNDAELDEEELAALARDPTQGLRMVDVHTDELSLCLTRSDLETLMHGGTVDVFPISRPHFLVSLTVGADEPHHSEASPLPQAAGIEGAGVG